METFQKAKRRLSILSPTKLRNHMPQRRASATTPCSEVDNSSLAMQVTALEIDYVNFWLKADPTCIISRKENEQLVALDRRCEVIWDAVSGLSDPAARKEVYRILLSIHQARYVPATEERWTLLRDVLELGEGGDRGESVCEASVRRVSVDTDIPTTEGLGDQCQDLENRCQQWRLQYRRLEIASLSPDQGDMLRGFETRRQSLLKEADGLALKLSKSDHTYTGSVLLVQAVVDYLQQDGEKTPADLALKIWGPPPLNPEDLITEVHPVRVTLTQLKVLQDIAYPPYSSEASRLEVLHKIDRLAWSSYALGYEAVIERMCGHKSHIGLPFFAENFATGPGAILEKDFDERIRDLSKAILIEMLARNNGLTGMVREVQTEKSRLCSDRTSAEVVEAKRLTERLFGALFNVLEPKDISVEEALRIDAKFQKVCANIKRRRLHGFESVAPSGEEWADMPGRS